MHLKACMAGFLYGCHDFEAIFLAKSFGSFHKF